MHLDHAMRKNNSRILSRRFHPFLLAFLFLLPLQTPDRPPLPDDRVASGWIRSGAMRSFQREDLYNHINGGAELFYEFGFERVYIQRYAMEEDEITLEMYRMSDPTAALGVYLMKAGKETILEGLNVRHTTDRYGFMMVRGPWFIQIHNPDGIPDAVRASRAFAEFWIGILPETQSDSLFSTLPSEGCVDGSMRIFRGPYGLESIYTFGGGDILSLRNHLFGVAATYRDRNSEFFSRLIIPYGTSARAKAAFAHLVSNLDPYLQITERKLDAFTFQDYRSRYGIVVQRNDTLHISVRLAEKPTSNAP